VLLSGTVFANSNVEIKQIEINGLEYSDARVVKRELPFREGDIWQPEFAAIGTRRLRNLGLFSEAVITPPDSNGMVRVSVNDRWPLWLLPEATRSDGGASSAGITLTEHNLWGLHHTFRLASRWDTGTNFSTNNGNSYQASYTWRRIADGNFGLDVAYSGGRSSYDAYQNGLFTSSYIQESHSWNAGISYGFGPVPGEGWGVRIGFASSDSRYNLQTGPPLPDVIGLRKQSIQAAASYRLIDDQITWLTGYLFDYSLGVAHKSLGSDINSYKQVISLRRHLDIGKQGTLSYRVNAGLVTGGRLRSGLFDTGGGNAVRGYFPGELQGNAYIYGTLEERYPLEINSNVQLVAFVDAAHVRKDGKPVLNRSIVAGVGGGVRWTLRWLINGTLRLDGAYGVATHRWRVHAGTGQAF